MKRILALILLLGLLGAPLNAAKKPAKKKTAAHAQKKAEAASAKKKAAPAVDEASASVVQVEGKVTYKHPQGSWEKAGLGLALHKLDMIKTPLPAAAESSGIADRGNSDRRPAGATTAFAVR